MIGQHRELIAVDTQPREACELADRVGQHLGGQMSSAAFRATSRIIQIIEARHISASCPLNHQKHITRASTQHHTSSEPKCTHTAHWPHTAKRTTRQHTPRKATQRCSVQTIIQRATGHCAVPISSSCVNIQHQTAPSCQTGQCSKAGMR